MKPIVSSFVFTEDMSNIPNNNGPGSSVQLINPINLIRPPFIPGTYSFCVTIGLVKLDPNREYILKFDLKSPDNYIVMSTGDVNVTRQPNVDTSIPPEANGVFLNLNLRNVTLMKQGEYKGIISVDGDPINEFPLYVYPKGDMNDAKK